MTELVGARRALVAAARVRDGVPAASGNAIGDIR